MSFVTERAIQCSRLWRQVLQGGGLNVPKAKVDLKFSVRINPS